ncbi:MAG: hypothetical protein AAF702_08380 [Chloroflexota bacterium]
MTSLTDKGIQAVVVNHNTSKFTELMLRTLYDKHSPDLDLSITVMDNDSTDETPELTVYLASKQIPFMQSAFSIDTERNSHGEVLSQFVLANPDCTYYLFLDADIYFLKEKTIDDMLSTLNSESGLFGVGTRQTWDGIEEIPTEIHPKIYESRLHPCCALIKNSPIFQSIVKEVGLTGVTSHGATDEVYWDTCECMTKVMKTHGYHHAICSSMVYHFFSVSYDDQYMDRKNRDCNELLKTLRNL